VKRKPLLRKEGDVPRKSMVIKGRVEDREHA